MKGSSGTEPDVRSAVRPLRRIAEGEDRIVRFAPRDPEMTALVGEEEAEAETRLIELSAGGSATR
jgi:hypothetical protein